MEIIMKKTNMKVVWAEVHEQNAIFIDLLVSVNEVLTHKASIDTPGNEKLTHVSNKVLEACRLHKAINISSLPRGDTEVTSEEYMNYFNALTEITSCISLLQEVVETI